MSRFHSTGSTDLHSDSILCTIRRIEVTAEEFLAEAGSIFSRFGAPEQDSGNVSCGVESGGRKYFVKTPGSPADPLPKPGSPTHAERVALLRNAVQIARSVTHPALRPLLNVIESSSGPLLVYPWAEGELLRTESDRRNDPASAYRRFRELPAGEIVAVLTTIFEVHTEHAKEGWVACDFYDGCLVYDFEHHTITLIDLDHYHQGPFENTMGRMFGSSRFMAPEEFILGARIDSATTVFTLGRTAAVLLSDGTLERTPFRGSGAQFDVICKACRRNREERYETPFEFHDAWIAASAQHRES